ncbi:MAG: hypothetical protein MUP47_05460 [Phycisphaerae bacterium]|nr:hypothetical protein [Phycisphaerae bacterium]
MSTRYLTAIALVAVMGMVTAARGQDTVVPKGENLVEVTVTAGGTTEQDAIRAAMRRAVEIGAGTYISSHSEVKDFVLIRDTILTRSAGFIQSHKVLSKRTLPDDTIEVKLVAVVSIQGIDDMWGVVATLLQQMGRPKIMVFIREKIAEDVQDDSTVQTRIENLLLESGFLLVDKEQLKAIDAKDLQAAAAEDSPARLQAIAKRFGAQLFITGTANANAGPTNTVSGVELFPYQAESNIRCYRSDTAQLLSSIPGQPTRGVDRVWRSAATKALDLQAQQVAPKVRQDILTFWKDVLEGKGEVQLHVEGLTFAQYTDLKKQLLTVKEIKEVSGPFHNQVAELSLQSEVTAQTLAEKLAAAMGQTLEITDVSENVIKAKYTGQ